MLGGLPGIFRQVGGAVPVAAIPDKFCHKQRAQDEIGLSRDRHWYHVDNAVRDAIKSGWRTLEQLERLQDRVTSAPGMNALDGIEQPVEMCARLQLQGETGAQHHRLLAREEGGEGAAQAVPLRRCTSGFATAMQ